MLVIGAEISVNMGPVGESRHLTTGNEEISNVPFREKTFPGQSGAI